MKIDADKREPASIKQDLGELFTDKLLLAGDYAFTTAGVYHGWGRKVVDGDLMNSIISGHMADEARKMLETFDVAGWIIEGPQTFDRLKHVIPNQDPMITFNRIENALLTHQLAGLMVTRSPSEGRTAERLRSLVQYFSEEEHKSLRMVHKIEIPQILFDREYNRSIAAIMTLPGISQLLAERLLKRFKSVHKIFTAEIADLCKVPGLGPKTAKVIYDFIRREWTDDEMKG